MTAHSVYFLALGELGLPGLGLLLYFIIATLRANQRLSIQVRQLYGRKSIEMQLLASTNASVISFAVAGAFLSCLYHPHIYVIAGLQAAVRNVIRQRCLQGGEVAQEAKRTEITIHPALRPAPHPTLITGTER